MMKLMLMVYDLGGYSGAAFQAKLLSPYFKDKFEKVYILNLYHHGKPIADFDDIKVINLKRFSWLNYVKTFFSLKKSGDVLIHNQGFFTDIIFFQFIFNLKYTLKLTMFKSDDLSSLRAGRFGYLKLFLARRSRGINCLTRQIYEASEKLCDPKILTVIPNCVDISSKEIPIEKSNTVLCVGVVCARKGTRKAIELFNRNFDSRFQLKVIGPTEGLNEINENYVKECQGIAGENVKFLGELHKSEVLQYMEKSRFLILLSDNEGLPNVVLEAMSRNCVPIISNMNGLSKEILPTEIYELCTVNSVEKKIEKETLESISDGDFLQNYTKSKYGPNEISKMNARFLNMCIHR